MCRAGGAGGQVLSFFLHEGAVVMIPAVLCRAAAGRAEHVHVLTAIEGKFADGAARGDADPGQAFAVFEGKGFDLLTSVRDIDGGCIRYMIFRSSTSISENCCNVDSSFRLKKRDNVG